MCDADLSCPAQWEYDAAVGGIAAPKEFPGNADIVILSFVIYAVFTSFLAGSTYFFLDGIVPSDQYNNMDRLMKQTAQTYFQLAIKTLAVPFIWAPRKLPQGVRAVFSNIWYNRVGRIRKDRLQSICLQLADTQLITGDSIMIVLSSTHCTVTQYHFFIGFELASLSFVTFQAILIAVVDVLHKSLFMRVWRFAWIVIIFGAIWASRFVIWNSYFMVDRLYGLPVQCTFYQLSRGRHYDANSTAFLAIESFNLVWSLWSMTVLLFQVIVKLPPFAQIISLTYWIMSWPSRVLVGPRNWTFQWRIWKRVATVLFVASLSVREIIFSEGFDLLRVYAMLIASFTQIFYERDLAASQGRKDDESEWGFGQILSILLLALPLSSYAEALCTEFHLHCHGLELMG